MHVCKRLEPIPGFERQSNCTFSCEDSIAAGGLKEISNDEKEKQNFFWFFFMLVLSILYFFKVFVMHFVGGNISFASGKAQEAGLCAARC